MLQLLLLHLQWLVWALLGLSFICGWLLLLLLLLLLLRTVCFFSLVALIAFKVKGPALLLLLQSILRLGHRWLRSDAGGCGCTAAHVDLQCDVGGGCAGLCKTRNQSWALQGPWHNAPL